MSNSAFPTGERKSPAAKLQEEYETKQRGAALLKAGTFNDREVRRSTDGLGTSGNVPAMLLKPASQVRREAAGEGASMRPLPSIIPKSATSIRRKALAEARDRAEVEETMRRASAAQVEREVAARAAEQSRKAAEAERAHKSAVDLVVRRAAFREACKRTLDINVTLPVALSALDRRVFALLVVRYTDAGNKAVKLPAADVAQALEIHEGAARDAIEHLREHGVIVDVVDASGVARLMPAAHVKATVTAGARQQ